MAVTEPVAHNEPPRGHVNVVYLGPVAPHWEVRSDFGDRSVIDEFRSRTAARLLLLPPHDPQFRRNRERVIRDAERENLLLEWDLGLPEEDSYQPPAAAAARRGHGRGRDRRLARGRSCGRSGGVGRHRGLNARHRSPGVRPTARPRGRHRL